MRNKIKFNKDITYQLLPSILNYYDSHHSTPIDITRAFAQHFIKNGFDSNCKPTFFYILRYMKCKELKTTFKPNSPRPIKSI